MSADLQLAGFDELKAEFARFAVVSRDASRPILAARAERARVALLAAYPFVTGKLREGVELIPRVGRGIAAVLTLRSGAPHAHLYEFGTVHERPHPTFLPITERERRAGTIDVIDYVQRQGITVDAAHD